MKSAVYSKPGLCVEQLSYFSPALVYHAFREHTLCTGASATRTEFVTTYGCDGQFPRAVYIIVNVIVFPTGQLAKKSVPVSRY